MSGSGFDPSISLFQTPFRFPTKSQEIPTLVASSKGYNLNLHAGIDKKTLHRKKSTFGIWRDNGCPISLMELDFENIFSEF